MDNHVATATPPEWDKDPVMQAFFPPPPEQLRRHAELCRRMARLVRDAAVSARLEAWADECDARAAGQGKE